MKCIYSRPYEMRGRPTYIKDGVLNLDEFLCTSISRVQRDNSKIGIVDFRNIYQIEEEILQKNLEVISGDAFTYDHGIYSFRNIPRDSVPQRQRRKRSASENYKPKFVRNKGVLREGLCEICNEWFRLKTSSYWYHMNFKHGINSSGSKYPEPDLVEDRGRCEARCPECGSNIPLGISSNSRVVKYNWYKHWQKAHPQYGTDINCHL